MTKFSNKTFLVDYRINESIEKYFNENNIKYIKTTKKLDLYQEINGHPDIVACSIGDMTVIEPDTYNEIYDKIKKYNILKGSTILNVKYPYDIAYNFVVTDKYVVGKIDYIDDVIKMQAYKKSLKFINVKQGYARCSTISLPDNIFITSDKSIFYELLLNNIKCFYIEANDIFLSERYNGFLGGSCGTYEDEILFFGNVKKMLNFDKLKKIFLDYDIKYNFISDKVLTDYGSMILI